VTKNSDLRQIDDSFFKKQRQVVSLQTKGNCCSLNQGKFITGGNCGCRYNMFFFFFSFMGKYEVCFGAEKLRSRRGNRRKEEKAL
jgi:hypothetical protein